MNRSTTTQPTQDDRQRNRFALRRWQVFAALLVAALLPAVFIYASWPDVLVQLGSWLDVGEVPRRVDAAFVFNGDAENRAPAAAGLINSGLARTVVCARVEHAGLAKKTPLWPAQHEAIQLMLINEGVAADQITILPDVCHNTFDEVDALAKLINGGPNLDVAVVTSDYHSRRVRWTVQQVLGDKANQVQILTASAPGITNENWWYSEDTFVLYVTELLKMPYYQMRYGNGLWWLIIGSSLPIAVFLLRRHVHNATPVQ